MRLVVRVGAGACAVFWALLFFGLIDLSVIVTSRPDFVAYVPLEASWGALFTFFVAGALVVAARRPDDTRAPAGQLLIVTVALLVASAATADRDLLPVAVAIGVSSLLLGLVARHTAPTRRAWQPDPPLLVVAALGAPFWVAHTMHAADVARAGAGPGDEVTWSISHWPMHVAAVLSIAAAALVASVWRPGVGLLATSACLAGLALGLASLIRPQAYAALPGLPCAVAVVLWSVAVGALAARRRARTSASAPTVS
jgi:hypothetical protein